MRTFYILVLAGIAAVTVIFFGSFFLIDSAKHRTYHYTVNMNGFDVGGIKMERFETETKIVYKSASNIPFLTEMNESKIRLDVDRNYEILSYTREDSGNGARDITALENNGEGGLSFLAINRSLFSYNANMPVRNNLFLFAEDVPLTYLPIIENYNFKRGRSQAFMALVPISSVLPPVRMFVTLTSINDEYIKVGEKAIKTEHLLVKIRNYPQGSIWVSKSDRSLVQLEIPKMQLRIKRTLSGQRFEAKNFEKETAGYRSRDVEFKSGNVRLAGTFSCPDKEGVFPAVLLVAGSGPHDRNYKGLFSGIADYLTRNGFCVLRYDNRGAGQSTGDTQSTSDADQSDDCLAALDFLSTQKETNADKISIIGHMDGAYYASAAAIKSGKARRLVLMSPQLYPEKLYDTKFELIKAQAAKYGWNDEYLKTAMRTILDTIEKTKVAKDGRTSILGYKCYVRKVEERAAADSTDTINRLNMPVIILQSAGEDPAYADMGGDIDKKLTSTGRSDHMLVYFSYLDPWFGSRSNDGVAKIHCIPDSTVLQSIRDWLNLKFGPEKTAEAGPGENG